MRIARTLMRASGLRLLLRYVKSEWCMNDERDQRQLTRLRTALQALSLDAERQIMLYPAFVEVADELVLEFDECWRTIQNSKLADSFAQHQSEAMYRLDNYIESVSGPSHAATWTMDALNNALEWRQIREHACSALVTFGWPQTQPLAVNGEFYRADS